mgnify:CR=1 FL=1
MKTCSIVVLYESDNKEKKFLIIITALIKYIFLITTLKVEKQS